MSKNLLSFCLIGLLIHVAWGIPAFGFAQSNERQASDAKVKAEVNKHANKKSRVTVKLKDGSKLKGNISQVDENSFTITDSKTGRSQMLNFGDVVEVKKHGGLSLVAKIGIGIGVAVGVLAILYGVACHDDPIC